MELPPKDDEVQELEEDIIHRSPSWWPELSKWTRPGFTNTEPSPVVQELITAFPPGRITRGPVIPLWVNIFVGKQYRRAGGPRNPTTGLSLAPLVTQLEEPEVERFPGCK